MDVARLWHCDIGDMEARMAREDLIKLIAAVRASIAQLTASRTTDERTMTRALAHLWSAHDELELMMRDRPLLRAS